LTNSTGHAVFSWNGTNASGNKMHAGNYTWWATGGDYDSNSSRYVYVYGGLNVTWKNNTENPNATYNEGDTIIIETMLGSLGPESGDDVNDTYLAEVNATLSAPNGTNYTVALVDPDLIEPKEINTIENIWSWIMGVI
jgi:hypothetical protein